MKILRKWKAAFREFFEQIALAFFSTRDDLDT